MKQLHGGRIPKHIIWLQGISIKARSTTLIDVTLLGGLWTLWGSYPPTACEGKGFDVKLHQVHIAISSSHSISFASEKQLLAMVISKMTIPYLLYATRPTLQQNIPLGYASSFENICMSWLHMWWAAKTQNQGRIRTPDPTGFRIKSTTA